MQNKLNFSFKSSIFAFKNPSKIEIEEQKIIADFPKIKFGLLQDGKSHFEIEKNNIFSMGFSFSFVIPLLIAFVSIFIGFEFLDGIYYQEEYGVYAMLWILFGFFGGIYMYDNIFKAKKKLEEMTLSIEFLIYGVLCVLAVILVLLALFKVGFTAIFAGISFAIGVLLILLSFSLKFQIVDKKWFAHDFPVLFWQFADVKRIFSANFPEFFQAKETKIPQKYENNINYSQTNTQQKISENISENIYIPKRQVKNENKTLLLWLLIGALVTTIISYFLPFEPTEWASFFKFLKMLSNRSDEEMWIFAFSLPILIIILLVVITFLKNISGWVKIFANILSTLTLVILFTIAFFPIHYINIFYGTMSAREIQSVSEDIMFGIWNIMLIIAIICMVIYTFKINSKK